ncbi:MAG TPA: hypothetical protein VFA67_09695 [Candidatus Sulfotelmatobacter sp.]|nr:hypothetical protein [Candidatus Sulfotelmatobacter sp.]
MAFPKAGQLVSPDGRFVVRTAEHDRTAGDFVGSFRSLWLVEVATGRARKLCDYWGTTMAGWSGEDFLIVTQYMSKKTSRTFLFSAANPDAVVVLDTPTLIQLLPPDSRDMLRGNDHVFIEGSRVQGDALYLRVWGYGARDVNGFRWSCSYSIHDGNLSCREEFH